jgi:iron complex transport system permease protein
MRPALVVPFLALACLAASLVGLAAGAAGWRADVVGALLAGDEIMTALRAPRVLLAAVVGGALALAGVCMQAVLRNPLADPYVLGMAGGASAGAVGSLALWPGLPPGPAAAAGAAAATAMVRALAPARAPYDPTRLLLAGVAVGAVLASATGLVLVLAPGDRLLRSTTFWLMGGFGTPSLAAVVVPGAVLLAAYPLLHRRSERLDRLMLGDDTAASLGTDPRRLRALAMGAGVALTAVAVAAGGLIGFVGLIAPHGARRLVGASHRALLPAATLAGALLVTVADTVARTSFAPREVPVGIVTAMVGGPLFLWLVSRSRLWA